MIPYKKQEAHKDKSGIVLLEAALHLNSLDGMAASDRTDASVNHDDVIYELETEL